MGPLGLAVLALSGWLWWSGRLARMTSGDGLAIALALLGTLLLAKGEALAGAVPLGLAGFYGWRRLRARPHSRPARAVRAPRPGIDIAEARELLGVDADADETAIRAAHRRIIALIHPDRGGTEALARKINAARDLLLRHHAEKQMRDGKR